MLDDSTNPESLEGLALRRFDALSQAELRLLRALPRGEIVRADPDTSDEANDPGRSDKWGPEREVRAHLIRWLCVDSEAVRKVDPGGIQLYSARITGRLNLSYATVPFPLKLMKCRFDDVVELRQIKIPELDFSSSHTKSILASNANVAGDIHLRDGFAVEGELELTGARIGGLLDCTGGKFSNPGRVAIFADRMRVEGDVFLQNKFSADGDVRLNSAVVQNLTCSGGRFKKGEEYAISADNLQVSGATLLDEEFNAEGGVILVGAQLGEGLGCQDATLESLDLRLGSIKGIFVWSRIKNIQNVRLRLENAAVNSLRDEEASWPARGNLFLDGFVYERIMTGPTDAAKRLDWLDRQKSFAPQPYRQLAKFLRAAGDDEGARRVLFEMERRTREVSRRQILRAPSRWWRGFEDALSAGTVGYGIYPERAIGFLVGMTALGWIVHRRASRQGAMAPRDKEAYAEFRATGRPPAYYPPFNALIYSMENCLPLVKFGQDERWQADPNPPTRVSTPVSGWRGRLTRLPGWVTLPRTLRCFRWVMIGLGWLLATFFVAALTGIIKTG